MNRRLLPAGVIAAAALLIPTLASAPASALAPAAPAAPTAVAADASSLQPLARCQVPTPPDVDFSEGYRLGREAMPSTGTGRITTLYVDFPDAPGDDAALAGYEDALDGGQQSVSELSEGKLQLDRTADEAWAEMPYPTAHYGLGTDDELSDELLADAVAATDAVVDFSQTDAIWLVFESSAVTGDVRSHAMNDATVTADGRTLNRAVLFSTADLGPTAELSPAWVVAHENGHTLGLADLYFNDTSAGDASRGTGPFDLMGYLDDDGSRELLAWNQWRLGWLADDAVSCLRPGKTTTLELGAVEDSATAGVALIRLSASTVLAVESRRSVGIDAASTAAEGALVYRIDASVPSGDGPVEVQFADGAAPQVRDAATIATAPLQPGDTYTDESGVTVSVDSADAAGDTITVDTHALVHTDTKRTIAYYQTSRVDNNPNNPYISPLPLTTERTGTDYIILAAIKLKPEKVILNDHTPDDPYYTPVWADLAAMQQQGVRVIGMVGGAENPSWETLSDDFDEQYGRLRDLINAHDLDGIDLDVETPTDIEVVEKVIDALRVDFGPTFLITLSPTAKSMRGEIDSLSELNYDQLYEDRGDDIDWFNLQTYCTWGEPTASFFATVYKHQAEYGGVPTSKLVMGALSSPINCPAAEGWIGLRPLLENVSALAAAHPDFGGVATWEYYNSDPGGTSAPWRLNGLLTDAMNGILPPEPGPEPTPVPGAGSSTLAATGSGYDPGPVALLALLALALGAGSFGAITRRRRARG
ncbi:glycosyl hydrolase family 18 protein [Cnuibacter physcomitrellae]|uniref:glycosyl hydrolase family 18 protein n=1 Tax=Cnuibacter physcomitrellae TaxID=1619308 RepID=UPI0021761169|nr:glycosyl hydrolase family 18 protein [Cnuibacter physcomitrellae]MCS5496143.1 glycosyl hydrolase family 18 protein [Cnuibacter physcomitrellae]